MEYRKITSANDWRELWLGKFLAELKNRNLSPEETAAYRTVLSDYLTAYEGNPREIDVKKMRQFVVKRKKAVIAPLVVFYESVARSEKHVELLGQLAAPKPKAASKKS
jgi:uncharacterized protein YdaU (DUF1376 family)